MVQNILALLSAILFLLFVFIYPVLFFRSRRVVGEDYRERMWKLNYEIMLDQQKRELKMEVPFVPEKCEASVKFNNEGGICSGYEGQ